VATTYQEVTVPDATNHPADDERRRRREIRDFDRRQRIMGAAGIIDPVHQLSDRARLVLGWLAQCDETTCAGIVELLEVGTRLKAEALAWPEPEPSSEEGVGGPEGCIL
jgi:hypothetical protein